MTSPGADRNGGYGHRPDELTRQQVRGSLADNLYVEAGAGTGKTDALVTRLVELLATGTAQPEQIAAITFTRAAAFEMRSRLRSTLEKRATSEQDETRKAHLTAVVDSLDSLAIQTIHSFALSILRERPLDAGLPPVIEPLDDIQAAVEFDDRWSEWFSERIENDAELASALGVARRLELKNPVDRLRQLAQKLGEQHQNLRSDLFAYHGPPPPAISTALLARTLAKAREIAAAAPVQDDKMCIFVNDTVAPELESLLLLAGESRELPAADFADVPSFNADRKGAKKNWSQADGGEAALTRLRELLSELQLEIDNALDLLRQATLASLLTATAEFSLQYAVHRRVQGRLTFHDQLVLAQQLLQRSDEARETLRSRFRHILVDEFQDTDPVQIELLRLLAGTENGSIRPGSLFIVGDPKQSIYRFRGADPVSAGSFSAEVAASGNNLPLSENHRSLPGILKWVNTVFSGWMKEGEARGQAPHRDLQPDAELEAQEAETGGMPVQWFGGERDVNATDTRRLEFEEISAIAVAAGSGAFRVRNDENDWRDSTFADVAVLMRRRTGIDLLEDALNGKDVPYVLDSQSSLFTSQDVRDLHACLTAIDDPADQVAVLAAVRSPAFSCPDTDLLAWKKSGGGFSYLVDSHPAQPTNVGDAFETLRKFHNLSREMETASVVETFIRERKLREKAMLTRLGPERARGLDLVVELANALAGPQSGTNGGSGNITLRDFTRWLARQAEENAQMPDRVSQGAVTDAVRVMTVHGAKGLEFPIVIMASASSGQNNNDSIQLRTLRTEGGEVRLEVQLGEKKLGLRTAGADDAVEREKADGELEDVRLLYVAATRARDHLLISRYRSSRRSASRSLVPHIEKYLEGNENLWHEWSRPPAPQLREQPPAPPPDTRQARDDWETERSSRVSEASRPRYTTPTALKPEKAAAAPLPKEPSESLDDEPVRPGRAATDIGRAVHAVLQHVDLTGWTDVDLNSLADRMSQEHGVEDRAQEITGLSRAALSTETMTRAVAAAKRGQAWREVSVAAALKDTDGELEGQVDLLFIEIDGSLTVVDHKTDRDPGTSLEDAAEPYLMQMGAYAWCVERVSGMPVSRAVLLFASRAAAGDAAEYEVPDLPLQKERAARMATELVSASTDTG